MDEDTRGAIDSILTSGKSSKRSRPAYSKPDLGAFTTREEAFRMRPPIIPPIIPAATRPTYCYTHFEDIQGSIDLRNEVATLSVDTASASIILKAPLTAALINRIEAAVPITQREWLVDKRAWRFSPAVLAVLKPILKDEYKDILMLGVPKALPSTKFDQLMSKLTKDDRALMYSLLAKKYHPDKGGSHEIMTLINIVFRG